MNNLKRLFLVSTTLFIISNATLAKATEETDTKLKKIGEKLDRDPKTLWNTKNKELNLSRYNFEHSLREYMGVDETLLLFQPIWNEIKELTLSNSLDKLKNDKFPEAKFYKNIEDIFYNFQPQSFPKLKRLTFGYYKEIHKILDRIVRISSLKSLGLFCCEINELPDDFTKLTQLRHLDLTGNLLNDDSLNIIAQLSSLEELRLCDNHTISKFPETFTKENLPNLKKLYLNGTNLNQKELDRIRAALPNTKIYF